MIKNIIIKKCGRSPKGGDDYYFRNLYKISNKDKTFEFTDGINVIVGPNGCGKTTLVNILARKMSINNNDFCQSICKNLSYFSLDKEKNKNNNNYEHYLEKTHVGGGYVLDTSIDYSNVLTYFLNRNSFNHMAQIGSMIAFGKSQSFYGKSFKETLASAMVNLSNGESSIYKLSQFLESNNDKLKFSKENISIRTYDFKPDDAVIEKMIDWQNRHEDENSKPTLLIDEIDEGMDLSNQIIFWKFLIPNLAKKYQIIIVSHSSIPFSYQKGLSADFHGINFISFFDKKQENFINKNI